MALLIAPILFIGAVLYVAYPLLSETEEIPTHEGEKNERERITHEKEEIVEILKDIDMDFRMGKLSSQDYDSLRNDFERQAVERFQQLESLEKKGGRSGRNKS
jgi:hypothetical protein